MTDHLIFLAPEGADNMSGSLWTPTEVTYVQSWRMPVKSAEATAYPVKHEFMLKFMGEIEMFGVLAEEDDSDAQIEDMAAAASERAMRKIEERVQQRGNKLKPEQLAEKEHWDHRRDLAGAWRDMRANQAKRRASTNGKLYYPGLH